jgi:hypothetical protein
VSRFVPFLGVLLAGCPAEEPAPEPTFDPTVSFLAPDDGATVPAGDVAVTIVVDDFELSAPTATARWRPVSPLWLFVPVAEAHPEEGIPTGYCELSLDGVKQADLIETQYTLTGVAAGSHTLTCELYYVDGDEVEPPVSATISFTAE